MNNTEATWTIARNDRTTMYEVHADGCRHLIARHLDVMTTGEAFATGAQAAAAFEAGNEGCLAKLGPCAR